MVFISEWFLFPSSALCFPVCLLKFSLSLSILILFNGHSVTRVLNRLLVSISFPVLFPEFSPALLFGTCSLCPKFGYISAFVSIDEVNVLHLPILAVWPNEVNVLWGPMAQSPEPNVLYVGCVCSSIVVES